MVYPSPAAVEDQLLLEMEDQRRDNGKDILSSKA